MRLELGSLLIALFLSSLSGFLILKAQSYETQQSLFPVPSVVLEQFRNDVLPLDSMDLTNRREFIQPDHVLPHTHEFALQDLVNLQKFAQSCDPRLHHPTSKLQKAWLFHESLCFKKKFPDQFFEMPPFFHPFGSSYAFLAKQDASWNEQHQTFFHSLELIQSKVKNLAQPQQILSQVEWEVLDEISQGKEISISSKFIFLKKSVNGQDSDDRLQYDIYDERIWKNYWLNLSFRPLKDESQLQCSVRENGICWIHHESAIILYGRNPFFILLGLSAMLIIILAGLIIRKIGRRQNEKEKLSFALQMLTHELRTPLTSLALNLELLRDYFDELSEKNQFIVMRIFDQAERLRRVADTSTRYLEQQNTPSQLLKTQLVEVSSLSPYIYYALDPYLSEITLSIDADDHPIHLDPYWTGICLKNLVENALKHGAKPVNVSVTKHATSWQVIVEDQGFKTFDYAKKNTHTDGLGIGIRLVKQILPFLQAEMTVEYMPTRVTIRFQRTQ